MEYKIKIRRRFFWKTIKAVGHKLVAEIDRMDIFLKDGSIYSVGQWSKYDVILGTDWVLFTKKQMEEESGQDIKLKSNIGV